MLKHLVILALTFAVCLQSVPVAHAKQTSKKLARGVTLITIKRYKPNLRARVVRVKPKADVSIRTALGQGRLPGVEPTSSIARRRGALVAINGDYAQRSGRPVMTFANRGKLIQTPRAWGRNFAVSKDQRQSFIGAPKLRVELNGSELDAPVDIKRVNNGKPGPRQLAMFTRAGGKLERPPKNSCSARLLPSGSPRAGGVGVTLGYRVDRVRCGFGRLFPLNGVTLSARRNSPRAPVVKALADSSEVSIAWSLGWERAHETVGGNPTLIEDGRIVVGRSSHPFFQRHPRTGVGKMPNGNVLFVTVDGRQKRSRGMTLRGFARLFRSLGADWALNLDGGGSTTMVVRGKVINRPSDRSERPVSSALLVVPGKPEARVSEASVGPEPTTARTWRAAVEDPASTGGLASSLMERAQDVPPTLRQAAIEFDSDAQGDEEASPDGSGEPDEARPEPARR